MSRHFSPQQFQKLRDLGSATAAAAKAPEVVGVDSRTAEAMAWDTARAIQGDKPLKELDSDERENATFCLDLAIGLEAKMRSDVEDRNAAYRVEHPRGVQAGAPALVGLSS
jgi:hypothetical protein